MFLELSVFEEGESLYIKLLSPVTLNHLISVNRLVSSGGVAYYVAESAHAPVSK